MQKRPYNRAATGNVINAGFNYLSDLIVRPGIEKKFWPILLYRGNMNPGHAHRLWNLSLLMMASEAETLSDGLKIANNPAFSQICGPVRTPTKRVLYTYFGRLWDNPDTTDLIPGFTEYVRSLELGPSGLQPVELETYSRTCAAWRKSLHPNPLKDCDFRPERGAPVLFYPYAAHNSSKPDEGRDLVLFVNSIVPATLPEQWRADACQEIILGILAGDISRGSAHDHVAKYIRKAFKDSAYKFEGGKLKASMDARLSPEMDDVTLHDVLHDNSYRHWSDEENDPDEDWDNPRSMQ